MSKKRSRPDMFVDKIAMLLSTDWFFPYWKLVGIEVPKKGEFQAGCREIVRGFVKQATSYYNIDFSEERFEATRGAFRKLSVRVGFQGDNKESGWKFELASLDDRHQLETASWLFNSVRERLLADGDLERKVRETLQEVKETHSNMPNFGQLCVESQSEWDAYIRSLTPELPNSLADWVAVSLIPSLELWQVLRHLNSTQRRVLGEKFKIAVKQVTGGEVVDPFWPEVQ